MNSLKQLTFLDIFAGIGGMRRGLESAGHRCVGYIEWDKWARKSYEAIYSTEGEWSATDVTTVKPSELPTADIWGFGFPCQDLSVAGKQLGFNGNRSSLFFTIVGLIRELPQDRRPEWLIAENVMGFLSSNRGYDFLAAQVALGEIGYDVEYDVFNATQFGIPQNRQRVFLVGHSRRYGRREVFPLRIDDTETRQQLGNVRSEDEVIGFETAFGNSNGSPVFTGVMRCLDGQQSKGVIESPQLKMVGLLDTKGNECIRRVYDPTGLSPTLTTMGGGNREPKILQRPRGNNNGGLHDISPTVSANSWQDNNHLVSFNRKDGLGEPLDEALTLNASDWRGINRNQTQNAVAVVKNRGEWSERDNAQCLDANYYKGIDNHGARTAVSSGTRIRKLTPLECWRLMGRSDDEFYRAKYLTEQEAEEYISQLKRKGKRDIPDATRIERMSDTQLYKQAGNSLIPQIVQSIGQRIAVLADSPVEAVVTT